MRYNRLSPDLIRALSRAYEGELPSGMRAASPIGQAQLIDWNVTGLLLTSGPTTGTDVGTQLFPVKPVDRYLLRIAKLASGALLPGNIKRPYGADFPVTRREYQSVAVELERFGRAGWIDADETLNQSSSFPDLSIVQSRQAQDELLRGLDIQKAGIVSDTSNYGLVSVGGTWTVDGTMLDQINAAAAVLTQSTGQPKSAFSLCLFNNTLVTAQTDALFLERRKFGAAGAVDPTLEDIRAYLGIRSVFNINSTYQAAEGAAVSYVFPSHAVLFYQGDPVLTVAAPPEMGIRAWGRTFRIPGVAMAPFYDNKSTTWYFPYSMREHVSVLDPGCAVLITNPQ